MHNIIWVEYKEKDHQLYICTGGKENKKTGVGLAREIWGLFSPVLSINQREGGFFFLVVFGCFWSERA